VSDNPFNFGNLIKEFQNLQKDPRLGNLVQKMKEEFDTETVEGIGEAFLGAAKVHVIQRGEAVEIDEIKLGNELLQELFVSSSADQLPIEINQEHKGVLEEIIKAACNDALRKAQEAKDEVRRKNMLSMNQWLSEEKDR